MLISLQLSIELVLIAESDCLVDEQCCHCLVLISIFVPQGSTDITGCGGKG